MCVFMLLALRNLGFQKKEPAEKANPAETRHPVRKLSVALWVVVAVSSRVSANCPNHVKFCRPWAFKFCRKCCFLLSSKLR